MESKAVKLRLSYSLTLFLCVASVSAEENKRMAVSDFFELFETSNEMQCTKYKYGHERALKRGETGEAEVIKLGVDMMCECMPKALNVRLSEMTEAERAELITLEELKVLVNPVMYKCGAPQLRHLMSSQCTEDPKLGQGVSDRAAYCDCFSKKLQDVDDVTIGEASVKAYLDFRAKAKAISEGLPATKESDKPDFVDQIDKACIANAQ